MTDAATLEARSPAELELAERLARRDFELKFYRDCYFARDANRLNIPDILEISPSLDEQRDFYRDALIQRSSDFVRTLPGFSQAENDDLPAQVKIAVNKQINSKGGLRLFWILRNLGAETHQNNYSLKELGSKIAPDVYKGRDREERAPSRLVNRYYARLNAFLDEKSRPLFLKELARLADEEWPVVGP